MRARAKTLECVQWTRGSIYGQMGYWGQYEGCLYRKAIWSLGDPLGHWCSSPGTRGVFRVV